MAKIFSWLFLSVLLRNTFCDSVSQTTHNYYRKLVQENVAKSDAYTVPKRNEEFAQGARATEIYDFGCFDFIIVGAGSAGCVLATRLSEVPEWKILLLEAGGEENDFSQIPAMSVNLAFSDMNWGYFSTPVKNAAYGMENQELFVPRGKVVGGSSSINDLMYVRGNRENYNHWPPGWSYEENLPFFIKSENSQVDGQKNYEGKGGLWNVEYSSAYSPTLPIFVKGNKELGQNYVDYNGKDQVGVGRVQYNTKIGVRQSTGTAFLDNARKRKNLTVLTKALVVKVLIGKENNTATGVQFIHKNKKYNATANNEVLLSAGVFNTPQLLMLSGIGPRTSLEAKGIPVITDLPVGQNLIEHIVYIGLIFRTNLTFPDNNVDTEVDMYLDAARLLCDPFKLEGVGFLLTNYSEKEPSIEYFYGPAAFLSPARSRLFNFNSIVSNDIEQTVHKNKDIVLTVTLLQPKSRGEVTLKSNDPIDFPNIDFKMFSRSEDISNMLAGINFMLKLSNTEAFQKINTSLVDLPLSCSGEVKYSDQYWECQVRSLSSTLHHASGTTAMGSNSSNSVVDNYLMVHGIQNLRIVDGGVIPSPISGHTNAPVVMIAEKMSYLIKKHFMQF